MNVNKVSYDDRVKPKNVLALNEKVAAIRRYEIDPVYKSVGRFFNCSPDQIKRIVQQKNEILLEWNNRTKKSVVPTSHEVKSVKMSFLGKAVHEWIRRMMYYTDFNLTNTLIQTMAIEFKKSLELQNFIPDSTWVMNFRTTYNLKEVNTKDLDIGYQESHSVQIRDILRHLRSTCAINGESADDSTTDTASSCTNEARTSIQLNAAKCKEEPDCDVEMKSEINDCRSKSSITAEVQSKPPPIPILLPVGLQLAIVSVKSEGQPAGPAVISMEPEKSPAVISVKSEVQPEGPTLISAEFEEQPAEPEMFEVAINTHEEAINCVKVLEEFALLKENFRLIGLIERLEDALKEKP